MVPAAAPALAAPAPVPAAAAAAAAKALPDEDSSSGEEEEEEEEILDEFLYKENQMERQLMVQNTLKAFKLNPLEVLGLPFNATASDIKAKYRTLSLQVHPDKCDEEFREQAQKAFALLAQCKNTLLDDPKKAVLDELIAKAHTQVLAKKLEEWTNRVKAERAAAKVRVLLIQLQCFVRR